MSLPKMVSTRLSMLSSNQEIFCGEAPPYQAALDAAGYKDQLQFLPSKPHPQGPVSHPAHSTVDTDNSSSSNPSAIPRQSRRPRTRNIIWFHPPWNDEVSTNLGQAFLRLLERHFPKSSPLHKLFNKNNVKISYSCLPNMASIISRHNKKILTQSSNVPAGCNCQKGPSSCPVDGQCLQESVIYTADVTTEQDQKRYIGSTAGSFKDRYTEHVSSFKLEYKETSTKLATYIWELKRKSINYNIKWRILRHAKAYTPESQKCRLCTAEKVEILFSDRSRMLNKRSEIMNKCRHKARHKLSAVT